VGSFAIVFCRNERSTLIKAASFEFAITVAILPDLLRKPISQIVDQAFIDRIFLPCTKISNTPEATM
jgi:hypothetical protein